MAGLWRREALKLIGGAAPLAFAFDVAPAEAQAAAEKAARAVAASAAGQPYRPRFFTAEEWQTVRILCDMILPRDERSPGAAEVGVPEFIDFIVTDPMEDDRGRERRQTAMRGGLAFIDLRCEGRFGRPFRACGDAERRALLDEIAYWKGGDDAEDEAQGPATLELRLRHGEAFFHSFRDLVAAGFWSSPAGVQDIGYVGNTFVARWSGPPAEVLRRLGLPEE